MENIDQLISPELRAAVQRFGFDKVAAAMYGVSVVNEKTASEIIGAKLMSRLSEWEQVKVGMKALKAIAPKVSPDDEKKKKEHEGKEMAVHMLADHALGI